MVNSMDRQYNVFRHDHIPDGVKQLLRGDCTACLLQKVLHCDPGVFRKILESLAVVEHKVGLGGECNFILNIIGTSLGIKKESISGKKLHHPTAYLHPEVSQGPK